MTEIDSLEIKISANAEKANTAIRHLTRSLGALSSSLKFDTTSLEKLGKINGNNFKKLGEGLQSFANAAKNLQNINASEFAKLAIGLEKIANIDPSKLEALGKIDGNSFRGLGEGIKYLSSGLQSLQGAKKSDFNRLAAGIERLASVNPGNMEMVGNALKPLADGINILSNAKFDNGNLQNLINSLTRLSNSNTANLANIDFSSLGNSIKGLADTLSGAEKVQQNTISMTNAVAKLASAGENANIVSQALPQLGIKLKEFMNAMSDAPNLENNTIAFAQALAQLANAGGKAETTASGLPKLGESLKNIFDTMSRMPAISENTIRMTQALAQLANAGGKAGSSAINLNGRLNALSSSMHGLRGSTLKAVNGLRGLSRQLLSSMGIYLGIYGAIRGIKKSIDISSQLTEVQNVVDVTFGDMAYKVEDFAETSIEQFGMSELSLKKYASRFQAMGSAMGIDSSLISQANSNLEQLTNDYIGASDSMSDVSLNLTKLTADMASFYDVEQSVVAEDLAAIFTGQTRPLRDYGLDLTQATLQEWAMKQGIDANIQSMSQAEKTMLRYQYVMANTGAAQGDFARTANTWANQVRILKQNFEQLASIMGTSFINALKPLVRALNSAMSYIIAFAKTVSNALGKIFGWTYEEGGGVAQDFEDASGYADDLADSTGTATKNIKKMQTGLRAFDELKVINMPEGADGAGGGSGVGAGAGTAGTMEGTWIKGESLLDEYESEIDTLYKLGEYISKTLIDTMEKIDWDKVYEKARGFGKGLADFLNGLFAGQDGITLFGEVGKTIASALNTAIYSMLSFGETFDFEQFGYNIADGINNFFETFDFAALAQTINVWAKGILDTVITAIDNTDWGMIGEQIGTFFSTLDIMEILGKLGVLAKKAAKAFTNAWVGAFKKAPLETLLISLLAIPKALKAIILSKFITGIAKIATNFVKFGKNTLLVTSALAGNQTALATLSTNYPRLGKAVDVARKAFANFRFGVENGNFMTGLNAGITTIRNNLTGLQKGAITAVAGFAEFNIVSDAFEGLTLGTENLVSGFGKIGVAVAAAGAAMYVALGPTGLAIAAITGVAAAIKGINGAFDSIRAEEIGSSIKNAMSNPGGVPLSEITSNFANALSEAATGFDTINEKSSEMKSVQKNIENTWTEIYKTQEAMENGVLSVEEGKAQLETLFSELATLTEQKFSTMNTVIMSAYGEGGSFRTALENMGADTESAIDTMITYGYQNSERAKEIAQELARMDINSEKYRTLTAELATLTGEMSSFEKATSDFTYNMNALQGKIDYSEIFLPDGSIDTEALQIYLNEATTALSDYETSLDDAGKEISQYWQEIYNSTTATDEQKAIAQANLEYIPQAIESMKKDAELQIVGFTDTMQNEFLARTSQIIDDSVKEWESKNAFEKWWNGIWGAGTKGEYVKEAVDQQQANIEEVSSAIEESLGSLQTEGVAWANDAAKEIYGALFDSEYIHSEVGIGHYKYTLNEDYREVIEGATEGIADLASERGKDAVDGYANGISDNTNTAESSAKSFVERVMDIIAKTQDSHSPSRVTKEFGKNAVEGYNLGISENQNSTFLKISEYTRRILEKLSEIISPLRQIGADAMSGLQNGLSSMEGSLYAKAQSIAQNIANTIKTALDIHSPSRVMFELGDYTMQGFRNGLENLYKPIISSAKMFSRDLQVASTPNINDMYGGYQSQTVYTPQYDITEHAQSGYNQSNAETNALLREILSAIKEGKTITIGKDEVGKVSMRYIQEEERRLQKSLVGIY